MDWISYENQAYVYGFNKSDNTAGNFYGDGKLLESIYLRAQDPPVKITLDVKGVREFKIEVEHNGKGKYAFANAIIE